MMYLLKKTDIVRRRMQTSGVTNCDEYVTIRQTLRKIYVEEGIIRGFFKGEEITFCCSENSILFDIIARQDFR